MKTDLLASELLNNPSKEADTLYKQYHITLSTLIDKYAPPHTKNTKAKYIPGWVNETVIAAKETKRLFERIWRRNKSTFNRSQYMQKVHQYNKICMQAKSEFLKEKIWDNHHNPQKLWRVLGDVLHRIPAKILPSINPPKLLADRFVEFFTEKIEKIHSIFSTSLSFRHITPDSPPPTFASFSAVTEEQVTKIIQDSPTKSCSLDPWPTFLVLEFLDILITPITSIINASLAQGTCPNFFKQAYVTPILKKSSLDKAVFKNYRPVSNLNFISKIQSAYRRLHSTETGLLKIQNDIAASLDSGKAVALTLLDLSAAFDTIDHDILFNSLRDWFGVDGTVLRWIRSYLSNRKQKVKLGNSFSDVFSLPYGVPQGSVLGPLLFTLYTTPLSNIISNFNVTHHLYADDTQIYLALDNRNFDSSFAELTECLTCIQNWMAGVKLKLNPEKTEFIIIGDRQARESLITKFPTQLLGNSISPTDTVKNLGVIFDSGNTFSNHITNMCRACYYHLKDLRRIRKFLSVETAALLANSMISSRLDYCNSLLYGISKYNVAKLQKIQNALCRIVFRLDRTSHVTPFLQKLHWLPITYRILFKYNLITFKAINFSQPIYLSSLIKTSCLTRGNRLSLSSASHKKAIGRRGFVVASPIEWNRLPQSVRSQQTITGFRSQLKTYLLRLAYPPP